MIRVACIAQTLALGAIGCRAPSPRCAERTDAAGSAAISAESYVMRAVAEARVVLAFVPDGFDDGAMGEFRRAARALLDEALVDETLLGRVAEYVGAYMIEAPARDGGAAGASGVCVRDGRLHVADARVEAAVALALPGERVDATVVIAAARGRPATYGSVVVLGAGHGLPSLVHELGHALVGLGDEYAESDKCWDGPAPIFTTMPDPFMTPNVTLAASGAKWAAHVAGARPGGEGFSRGIYHPPGPCRMKDRREPRWCPVCAAEVTRWVEAVRDNDGPPRCDIALDRRPESLVRGQLVSVDVIAGDLDGVAEVGVTFDGRDVLRVAGARAARFQADARVVLAAGPHTLSARCRDADGRETRRDLVLQVR